MNPLESKQTYAGQTFRDLDVAGAKISRSDFDSCTFEGCNFMEAVLSHCRFTKCRFAACDLSVVSVGNCRFVDVEFVDSKLIGVDWTAIGSAKTDRLLFSASFERCVLDYGSFYGLTLRKLCGCTAKEVEFSDASMAEADCQRTDFAGAKFSRTDLRGANFVGATAYAIDPTVNKVKRARFSYPEVTSLLAAFDVIVDY